MNKEEVKLTLQGLVDTIDKCEKVGEFTFQANRGVKEKSNEGGYITYEHDGWNDLTLKITWKSADAQKA